MSELLKPFEATSNLIGTKLLPAYILHGIFAVDDEALEVTAQEYEKHILAQA